MQWTTRPGRGLARSLALFLVCLFFSSSLLFVLPGADCTPQVVGQWRLLAPVATSAIASSLPSARCNQCSVYVPSADRVYVFGGNEGVWQFLPLNDLWAFDVASSSWTLVGPNDDNAPPPKRFRHSCVYDEVTHAIFVFGGMTQDDPFDAATILDDLWKYDVETNEWIQLKPNGPAPPPRYYHVAALQRRTAEDSLEGSNLMVVFGGIDATKRLNDMWLYDIANGKWQQAQRSGSRSITPPPLSNPAARATEDGEYLYLFGGQRWWGYQGIINLVFKCHLPTKTWSQVQTKGTPPDPRIGATAVILHGGQSMLVFGGYNVDGFYVNDLHLLDLATSTWQEVTVEGDAVPAKRYAHSAMPQLGGGVTTAEGEDGMIVFGGYSDFMGDAHNFHDLWRLSFAPAGVTAATD